jgi:hypothetical protein
MQASAVCDVLPRLRDDPSLRVTKVKKFCQLLKDCKRNGSLSVAVDHLLIAEHPPRVIPEVLEALQVSVDPATPTNARVGLLCTLLHPGSWGEVQGVFSRAMIRCGAREACLHRLQQPDLLKEEEMALTSLFQYGEEDAEKMVIDVCLSLGNAEPDERAAAARALAAFTGRFQLASFVIPVWGISFQADIIKCLIEREEILDVLVDAIGNVERPVAANITRVLAAIANRNSKMILLVGARVVPALLELLAEPSDDAAAAAAEALYHISRDDQGQEAILAAKPVPRLLETALQAYGSASHFAGCVLGNLAFHPDARQALATLVSRADDNDLVLPVMHVEDHCPYHTNHGCDCAM